MNKDKWADYWEHESETGECFVSASGQKNPELIEFWQAQFNPLNSGTRVLDVASGAGSIFSSISARTEFNMFATDLSVNALQIQQRRNPSVHLIVSEANVCVFAPNSFNMVVSQFGIEYAPKEAFQVAADVLKSAGRLVFLCHIKNGFIDQKNQSEKAGIELSKSTSFIDIAAELTRAMYAGNKTIIQKFSRPFQIIEPKMAAFAREKRQGFQQHLYNGYRSMMQNLRNYRCEDVIDWLTQMQQEMVKIETRLDEMINAAQSREDVADIARILVSSGCEHLQVAPFYIRAHDKPIAWQIIATKAE